MADISRELAAIMSAVYGRDVRSSIHDAIKKVNDATEVALLAGTDISSTSSSTEGYFKGSLYINTNTWSLWQCQEVSNALQWVNLGQFGGQDGNSILSITKTGVDPQHANIDIYTITYSDPSYSSSQFSVTNGIDGTHGSVWYKGTALSGEGTVYGYPGVATDMYLNSLTGNVYQCIRTGDGTSSSATGAQWEYVMVLSGGGGGSSGDEWSTASYADASMNVVFDNLSDDYGYDLYADDVLASIISMTKGTGTNSGIKLTYVVDPTGISSGVTPFYLRILKDNI